MGWNTWWRAATEQAHVSPGGDDSAPWPSSHVADRDPCHVRAILDELQQSRRALNLHVPGCAGALVATLVQHAGDVVTLRTSAALPQTGLLPDRVNVTTATPRELVMFSVQTLRCSEGTRLQVVLPTELLHLQSREHFRVRCVRGPMHQVALRLPDARLAPAQIEVIDLSEGGAGVLITGGPWAGTADVCSAALRVDGEELPVSQLRIAHCAPCNDGRWRLGLQFERVEPPVARALRRSLAVLETAAGA